MPELSNSLFIAKYHKRVWPGFNLSPPHYGDLGVFCHVMEGPSCLDSLGLEDDTECPETSASNYQYTLRNIQ